MDNFENEIKKEIEVMAQAFELLENGCGNLCEVDHILSAIKAEKNKMEERIEDHLAEKPVFEFEREFDREYDRT